MHAFYAQRTIHLAEEPDAADRHGEALCGKRLIGAIDTQAEATCPGCLRRLSEMRDGDTLDAMRDAEQDAAARRAALSDAYPENLAAPRAAYPASVGGGAKIHAALLPAAPEGDGADLGAATIACGAGRRSFTSVGYSFAPTIRSRPSQAIDCAGCLRGLAAHSTPLGEPAAAPGDGLIHLMSDALLDACGTAGPGGLQLAPSSTPERITCPACQPLAAEELAAEPEQQSPLHQRAIVQAIPLPPAEGSAHVALALAEADRAPSDSEPRELIGCEARDLQLGDLIVAAGCQHRDGKHCDHRLYAAFDLLLQDGEQGERMTLWTAIADQEAGAPPRLTLPGDRRLLVQRRLPAADPGSREQLAALLPEPPALCGPAGGPWHGGAANGGHDWDLNVSWTCKRTAILYTCHSLRDDVLRQADQVAKHRRAAERATDERRAASQARKARGLGDWTLRATVRYGALIAGSLRDLPPCGHAEADRRELTVEAALPGCTC